MYAKPGPNTVTPQQTTNDKNDYNEKLQMMSFFLSFSSYAFDYHTNLWEVPVSW